MTMTIKWSDIRPRGPRLMAWESLDYNTVRRFEDTDWIVVITLPGKKEPGVNGFSYYFPGSDLGSGGFATRKEAQDSCDDYLMSKGYVLEGHEERQKVPTQD